MEDAAFERLNTATYTETYEMTDHDWETVKKAFNRFSEYDDKRGANVMSAESLPTALRAMKLIPSEKQIAEYTKRYFESHGIDEETFRTIASDCWIDDIGVENAVWNAFAIFDKLLVGKVTPEVLRRILLELGEPLPEEEVELILKRNVGKDYLVPYAILINQWKKINIFPKPKTKGKKGKSGAKKSTNDKDTKQ